jgi:hypothetical protein
MSREVKSKSRLLEQRKKTTFLRSLAHTTRDGDTEKILTCYEIAAAMQEKAAWSSSNNRQYTGNEVQGRRWVLQTAAKEARKKATEWVGHWC